MAVHNYNKARLECYVAIKKHVAFWILQGRTEVSIDKLYAVLSLEYGYSKRFVEECIRVLCMNTLWKVIYNDANVAVLIFDERQGEGEGVSNE